jgi:hypothetical protein
MSRCLFSFVTRARRSRPFYALRATPKTALNFSGLVGRLVGRSQRSHTNDMLPIQFCHPGPPFPTLYALRGTPKTFLNFVRSVSRSVSRSVGHGEVTGTSRCFFSFVTGARPSRPFYALRATPKMAFNNSTFRSRSNRHCQIRSRNNMPFGREGEDRGSGGGGGGRGG